MSQSTIPPDRKGPDMSHIESAYRPVRVEFYSSTAKSFFERRFDWVQIRLHYLLVLVACVRPYKRTGHDEKRIKEQIGESEGILDSAIVEAKDRLKGAGVPDLVINHSSKRAMDVKIFTACAHRFLELIVKYDQATMYLKIMSQSELISKEEMEQAKKKVKAALQKVDRLILALYKEAVASNQKKNAAAL